MARISAEDQAGVAQLFFEEAEDLMIVARRACHGDERAAEDVLQETFHDAALNWPKMKTWSQDRMRAWLRRVVKNKAIDRYRAERRVKLFGDELDDQQVADQGRSPEDVALSKIALDRCLEVIGTFTLAQRQVAYLVWVEGWETKRVAEYLGIDPGTVRVHLRNVRVRLEEEVGEEFRSTGILDKLDKGDEGGKPGKEA
ncbi:RNA polymerase sigma factor [Nonomuraea sp. NPDC003560]|uniref:RNA polymerase sigma factor n=1 Tax=Nonomuraea sp. NPDC003560 TaxID=3364341 RepID=UPI00367B3425